MESSEWVSFFKKGDKEGMLPFHSEGDAMSECVARTALIILCP